MEDVHFMQMAIAEAAKAGNETWKNPRVGAVVVKNGQVLARGHTHEYGGIHAETVTGSNSLCHVGTLQSLWETTTM